MSAVRLSLTVRGVSEARGRTVSRGGYYLDGRIAYRVLGRCLSFGLSDLNRHYGGHVMLAQGPIDIGEYDISLVRARHYAHLLVVAYGALGKSSLAIAHVDAAAQPGLFLHIKG